MEAGVASATPAEMEVEVTLRFFSDGTWKAEATAPVRWSCHVRCWGRVGATALEALLRLLDAMGADL